MLDEIAGLVPKTRLLSCYVEYRPWLKDKTHHYRVHVQYLPKSFKGKYDWRWVEAFSDDPNIAIGRAKTELLLRTDR